MTSTAALPTKFILTLNAGSSSLKFALFKPGSNPVQAATGKIDGVNQPHAELTFKLSSTGSPTRHKISASGPADCLAGVLDALKPLATEDHLAAAGHRVVHGGADYTEPQRVSPDLLQQLHRLSPIDPEHLPAETAIIHALQSRCPKLPQFACFDTAFHHGLPRESSVLPIPRRYQEAGIRRYGFHGLSYQFLLEELRRLGDPAAITGRVILAHLGNGASMAAVRDGRSIDTSMGFTPAAGLVMATRSGDLDPGISAYLARTEKMTAAQFQHMISHESGLLGVSGISSDMRILLEQETHDARAADAVALFCYQAKKWIGAYAAALGGIDTLVFAGGIGENCPSIRRRICAGLDFFGLSVDDEPNATNAAVISATHSRVTVRVIRTDEELMIARSVSTLLAAAQPAS